MTPIFLRHHIHIGNFGNGKGMCCDGFNINVTGQDREIQVLQFFVKKRRSWVTLAGIIVFGRHGFIVGEIAMRYLFRLLNLFIHL